MEKQKFTVKEFDRDLENGFAWVILENESGAGVVAQCCLVGEFENFKPIIDAEDCGHDRGICGDTNAVPFAMFGKDETMAALFSAAESNGVTVNNA